MSLRDTALAIGKYITSFATGYHPENSRMEGGYTDRMGKPLHTLTDYLAGKVPDVSIAIDVKNGMAKMFPYGTYIELTLPDGRVVLGRIVDTGGAFFGKGTSRIDICSGPSARTDAKVTGQVKWRVIDGPQSLGRPASPGSPLQQGGFPLEGTAEEYGFHTADEFGKFYGVLYMDVMRRKQQEEEAARKRKDLEKQQQEEQQKQKEKLDKAAQLYLAPNSKQLNK